MFIPSTFSAFHDETGRLNVDGMNIISNDGSNKLNRSRKARVSYKVQRTINASLNAATSTRAVSSNPNFVTHSGRLATKSNQIKQLIRNGRSASLQRTFKKSFTSFSHSTRNKTRDGLIRVRNIRALNGRFNTSITHAYSIVIGSKHI